MRKLALIALLLAGCAGPEKQAEQEMAAFGPYCQRLGLEPGTPQFALCVQNQAQRSNRR